MTNPEDDQTRHDLEAFIKPEDLDELEAMAADIIAQETQETPEEDTSWLEEMFPKVGYLMTEVVSRAPSDCTRHRAWMAAVKLITDMATSIGLSRVTMLDQDIEGNTEEGNDQEHNDEE